MSRIHQIQKIDLAFWTYFSLLVITVLNDVVGFYNMFFSFLYVGFCFYYTVKVIGKSPLTKILLLFSLLYLLYALISENYSAGLNSKWGMLNWTLKVMLTFPPAFYFCRKHGFSERELCWFGRLLFLVALLSYYLNVQRVMSRLTVEADSMTNNIGYMFVAILPLLFVTIKKNLWLIIIDYVFIMISMKRGAIVCAIATLPFFIYLIRKSFNRDILKSVFFIGLLMSVGLYYLKRFFATNAYALLRLERTLEGDSSGRDEYAFSLIKHIKDFSATELLFGKGINYTATILGNFAHNDWLELLTSLGLFGCVFYFLTFVGMRLYAKKDCYGEKQLIAYIIIIIFFIRTMVSMNYFSLDSIPLYFTLGLLYNKKLQHEKSSRLYSNL